MTDSNEDNPSIEPHDSEYCLLTNVEVRTWDKDPAMDFELYHALKEKFGTPVVVRVAGLSYEMQAEGAMPAESVVLPEARHNKTKPDSILVAK
jgi:hypothetical protein